PNYIDRLRIVAHDPVAAATFFQEILQAVFDGLLRVGAKDGDGGVLGEVKSYIGMTEEQFRLTLHAHLLVWVYGCSPENVRDDLGTSLERHVELARYVFRQHISRLTNQELVVVSYKFPCS
ncbi:unnamed protein product, partial [Laminaria digitata]